MRTRLFVLIALAVTTSAHAGAVLELVPDTFAPYYPEQPVTVEVWLHNGDAVGHDLRLVGLDVWSLGARVVAAGDFTNGVGGNLDHVAKLSAGAWVPVGSGTDDPVYNLMPCVGAIRPNLCAGGLFEAAGSENARSIAQWNGYAWSEVGGGAEGRVYSLLPWDNGTSLYIAGQSMVVDGVPTQAAKWDWEQWVTFRNLDLGVRDMAFFDDGTGEALYIGGTFTRVTDPSGSTLLNSVAKSTGWDWEPLGCGVKFGFDIWAVHALTVFDDGGGPALYVGGDFAYACRGPDDLLEVNNVAKWNGAEWYEVGGGVNPGSPGPIYDMIVFDDGSGPALYVGGQFTTAGSVGVNNIARWDGTSWSDVGGGVSGGGDPVVRAFTVFEDGTGLALYVGGQFTEAGGAGVSNVAKWDGFSWSPVGDWLSDTVRTLTVLEDTGEPSPLLNPTFEFDFSTLSDGGGSYERMPDLPYVAISYTKGQAVPGSILHLPAAGSLRIGNLGLVLPSSPGSYTVDLASPSADGGGAMLTFGFGVEPDDPVTTWTVESGDLTGGTYNFAVPNHPIPAVSGWGLLVMALLLLTAGVLLRTKTPEIHCDESLMQQ